MLFQKYKMNFDKNTGVIEMIMESLSPADEGTFTFQLQDGKATNQSSLVLIGDGRCSPENSLKLYAPLRRPKNVTNSQGCNSHYDH